jgi:predicted membrane-bound dolichyl-phosphate-mannose-protein mannosyltransferase
MLRKTINHLARLSRWQHFAVLLLVFSSFFLHIAVISQPGSPLFDELHYIPDARRIVNNEGTERTEHPPVAKLFIAGGIKVFGDNPWGWRMPAVILSTIAIALFHDICRKLGAGHKLAFIATLLLALENLTFIHGGIAMLDFYVMFFTILAFWLYLKGWWEAAAVAVALAGLSKVSGVLSIVPIGLHWLLTRFKSSMVKPPAEKGLKRLDRFIYTYGRPLRFVLAMALAPVAFLLLMPVFDYIIWGHWIDPIAQIKYMAGGMASIKFSVYIDAETGLYKAPLPSRPWEWILSPSGSFYLYGWLINPAKYTLAALRYHDVPLYMGILSPTIWLAGLLVIPFAIWQSFKKNNVAIFAVCWLIGTWLLWIPLSLSTDRVSFIFYFLPSIGAVCLGTGLLLYKMMEKALARRRGKLKRFLELLVLLFLVLHMVAFCWLSPVKLWVSIPACVLLLVFTVGYLGYNWKLKLSVPPEVIPTESGLLPVAPVEAAEENDLPRQDASSLA